MAQPKRSVITAEAAESLAIQALAFFAADPERLGRFLAVTGVGPQEIRQAAREPQFLAGVLDYLAGDEALLVDFAAEVDMDPAEVARACSVLGHGTPERDVP